jgi:Ca2+:H+ antiporter
VLSFAKREKELCLLGVGLAATIFMAYVPSMHFPEPNAVAVAISIAIFGIVIYGAIGVVHHAGRLSHLLGEPYGTLLLTLTAITVEVIMVATMMLYGDDDPTMGRDTIYCTVMIALNGVLGFAMLFGGLRYGEQRFNLKSANSYLSMIAALTAVGLLLPDAAKARGPAYTLFVIVVCCGLYGFFLRVQTKNHTDFFTFPTRQIFTLRPDDLVAQRGATAGDERRAAPREGHGLGYHASMLVLTIVGIAVIAEYLAVALDHSITVLRLPAQIGPIVVAIIIVSPEGLAALRAGYANDFQRTVNIVLGSALSTIALTVPAVLLVGGLMGKSVTLALEDWRGGLLFATLFVTLLSSKDGEISELQGLAHLCIFGTFLFGEFF